MNKNLKLLLATMVAATFVVSAHDTPRALVDSQGKAVKGDFGQCIQSEYNSESEECGAKKEAAPVAPPQVHSEAITLDAKALFDTDKSVIRPDGRQQLDGLANKINQGQNLGQIKQVTGVTIVGHTDSVGKSAYNQGLSERRAASVRNYLVSKGVSSSIIRAYGEGETNPVAPNTTREGRQQNRRVEVLVQGVKTVKK